MSPDPNGWTIWWLEEPEGFELYKINPHPACPAGQPCYTVSIAEFNMHSVFTKYTSSSKRWSVAHYGDCDDLENLKVTGKPPKIFAALRDEVLLEQQAPSVSSAFEKAVPNELKAIVESRGGTIQHFERSTVDHVFDLPAQLGQHFFGFRYDRAPEKGTVVRCAEVLGPRPTPEPQRSRWQRLWNL